MKIQQLDCSEAEIMLRAKDFQIPQHQAIDRRVKPHS
ncbi:hypothetical protein T01_230 [Trichinella spiralis]|uniref:Uncharacterized protein n=1 Tax=Trichinella spiralis TaxID=6334 RepID=A0A0V0YRX4_TRISP|nr:hypothetical protein T01_230 [Trichinella spiralis]